MKEWFDLSEKDRKDIIIQTSVEIGLPPAAIEKDWWVIIVLRAIFNTKFADHLVFKGGTSLSKAWGIIERFSEDIDLAMDRSYFGFDGDLSRKQVTNLRKASCKFVNEEFKQCLSDILIAQNVKDFELSTLEFERSDTDPVAIELKYKSLTENINYLQPRILIEISSRSLRDPYQNRKLISFIGEKYPSTPFADKPIQIPTVVPTRTLFEKIFLLHEEFQKPTNIPIKSGRMTRHLYDISRLMDTQFLEEALSDKALYVTIVKHRELLTNVTWVDYTRHGRATINFIPPESVMAEWSQDYKEMQESMFYGETETFKNLIEKLKNLNERINKIGL
jgi:predicted nucleotidyltransferase component of viral defense system